MCSNKTDVGPSRPGKTIFSLSELKKLLEQDNACVSCVTCQRSIDITPVHLADLKTSIRDLLDEKVTKYDVELQGVVLAHKNVKIFAGSVVFNDSRYFPLEYVADIYVFKPKIGSKLTGVVNKIPLNREYVSVLVHNIFNVVVYAALKQPKPAVKMGSSINLTVTYIDFTGRLPFIRAEISSEDLNFPKDADGIDEGPPQPLLTPVRKGLTSILRNSPARLQQSSTDVETESSCTEISTANQVADTSMVGEMDIRKKKKKKRDKERNDHRESGKQELSLSKKRKHRHDEDGESSSPSKKKKRKHGDRSRENELVMKENGDMSLNDTPINPLDSTAQIMADESIFKAASSTPLLGPPSKKKKRPKTGRTEFPEPSNVQQAVAKVKPELRTADSGISSSDEKKSDKSVKVKVKRESASSKRDTQNSSKGKSVEVLSSLNQEEEEVGKKKKKKKKEKKSETVDDINTRLLEEALNDLNPEK